MEFIDIEKERAARGFGLIMAGEGGMGQAGDQKAPKDICDVATETPYGERNDGDLSDFL